MNLLDRSNYFKGLLILAIRDNIIVEKEEEMLMALGAKLGFEKKFCHNAIQQSLGNEYLTQTPPVFSNKKVAEQFLIDGLRLAISDGNLDPYELQWLTSVSDANGFEKNWLSTKLKEFLNSNSISGNYSLLENVHDFNVENSSYLSQNI